MYFLARTLPIFEKANALLQSEEPKIHVLHDILCEQFSDIAVKFILPECILKSKDLWNINFNDKQNQKADDDLYIGSEAREYLRNNYDKCDIQAFYRDVRNYYATSCSYMIKMFPFGNEVLVNATFLNLAKQTAIKYSQLRFFCDRFNILNINELDDLEKEFQLFLIEQFSTDIMNCSRIDQAWHLISQIKSPASGMSKYGTICKVARLVVIMYHSNSDCERMFSVVNKNKTEFRSSLSTKTLNSLMTRKMVQSSTDTPCYAIEHSKDLLEKCKKATALSLNLA